MNTPNKISLSRIFLIPAIVALYLIGKMSNAHFLILIALGLLIIAEGTDFVDGYLARKNNQVTTLGKLLDSIADKLLTVAALLLVMCDGTFPAPYAVLVAIIIVGRELIISLFRQVAASKNFVMAADKWGKIKAIVQYIALPSLFLLSYLISANPTGLFFDAFVIFNYVLIGITVALTIASAMNYLIKNRNILK